MLWIHFPDQKFLEEMLKESMFFENFAEVSAFISLR